MPTLQEKLQKMEKGFSKADAYEVMADPNCEIRLPDGGVLPSGLVEAGKNQLYDYLAEKFPAGANGNRSILLIDKNAPNAPPHAVEFSEDGAMYFGVVRSAKEFAARLANPRLQEPKEPKEPKAPSFGAKLKEFFSFFTGGSRTVREYRKYEQEKAAYKLAKTEYDSRVYDIAKKAGYPNPEKPEKYAESAAPQPQPADHAADFGKFCASERERLNRKLWERVNKAEADGKKSSLTEGLKLGLDYENEKGPLSDKTLRVLASLDERQFWNLQFALDQKGWKLNHRGIFPEMVPDVLEHFSDRNTGKEFVSAIELYFNRAPEIEQAYFRRDHPVGELGPEHEAKRREELHTEYHTKIHRRLEKLDETSELGKVIREGLDDGKGKEKFSDEILQMLADGNEDFFTELDKHTSGYRPEQVRYVLKYAETLPEEDKATANTMLFATKHFAERYTSQALDEKVRADENRVKLRERLSELAPQSKLAAGLTEDQIDAMHPLTLAVLTGIDREKFMKVVAAVENDPITAKHVPHALVGIENRLENEEIGKKEIENCIKRELTEYWWGRPAPETSAKEI